ncbi:MAG: nicotinate-nucleotide adenylyltransferase [Algibacter sp.]|uniref:nicotinate-nucleotide adenylyltransferase n=1 Tax=Algibacter sp. TaxID=1872428 RepID=UPI00260408D8|nr:nicotinate-nucleotide adenylyltransferase [Algibacter sp.]MDG1731083.1 nicotinate-nucleotide adenylyltransferase [Algibacter sp.]MDG2179590.1 nicotinate-nucleotide adenylyltransferase [Algibacter sp.]
MKKIVLGLLIFGLTIQVNAQTVELNETLISVNYKYLDAVDVDNIPERVKKLEEEVLNYKNVEQSKLYDDKHDTYSVSFYVPEGKIVAAYDINGKIIRTIEKYNNVRLPLVVMQAVSKRFPNWGIVEDIYYIRYHIDRDSLKQEYKIKLKNEDETITVKTNEKGTFL